MSPIGSATPRRAIGFGLVAGEGGGTPRLVRPVVTRPAVRGARVLVVAPQAMPVDPWWAWWRREVADGLVATAALLAQGRVVLTPAAGVRRAVTRAPKARGER